MSDNYENLIYIMKDRYNRINRNPQKTTSGCGCEALKDSDADDFLLSRREVGGLSKAVDVANYRKGETGEGNCASCKFFDTETNLCKFFNFTARPDYTCDEWKPKDM